jgi:branched-chain amino acid transport system substrate-binding protein
MRRRRFLAATAAGAAALAVPAGVRSQARDPIRIGIPLPLTGPFAVYATDLQRGAVLAAEDINARGGPLGRPLELLFRDDEFKPGVGAQRAIELIERERVHFLAGAIGAHIQMAINEQSKKARLLYFSLSQSDEITARPDASPYTFHEAMNPTITARAVGSWAAQNLGKRWWILYADYAWGKQNNAVFGEVVKKHGGSVLGRTPYPIGIGDFSAFLPKIQAARPEVLISVTPGNDGITAMKQMISFGMKRDMKHVVPLHVLTVAKAGGGDLFAGVYGGQSFYWELEDTIPTAKRFVEAMRKRFGAPPDLFAGYAYSAIKEIARGVELARSTDSEAVARALRGSPVYDHYKGKQWWRACDNKSFQDLYVLRGRDGVKGEWGFFEVVTKIPASEEMDRTCAEKGHA